MTESEAAEIIWRATAARRPLPAALRGALDFDAALRVQLRVLERQLAAGQALAGWKIGLTSQRVRDRFGTDRQPFGYLLRSGMHESGAEIALAAIHGTCGVEPELCWTLGAPLAGPGTTPEQARGSVASLAAGLEINEPRAPASDFPLVIADGLAQWGVVTGPPIPLPDDFASDSVVAILSLDGERIAESRGTDVIDDHFVSLAALANALGRFGRRLEAGDRVITGSFSRHDVTASGTWRAQFSGVGTVEVRFR